MSEFENIEEKIQIETLKKLIAERQKFEAEKNKIEQETLIEKNESKKPWFRKDYAIKAIVAALVSIPLVWFYVTQVALPLFESEKIEAKLEIAKIKKEFEVEKEKFEREIILTIQKGEKDSTLTEDQKERLISLIYITIEIPIVSKAREEKFRFSSNRFSSFQELLDFIYLNYLQGSVGPYTYGTEWVLQNPEGQPLKKAEDFDYRSLDDLRISTGKILKLKILR